MLKGIKSFIKFFLPFSFIKSIYRSYLIFIGKSHPIQKAKISKEFRLKHFGSKNHGWTFVDDKNLYNSVIISAGLGEDASFDLEFVDKYKSKVIIIDPTPRAIVHYNDILDSLGNKKEIEYSNTGKQPINAYELSNIHSSQLVLIKKALWNNKEEIKFFEPKNKDHVSHSINNYQNNYKKTTEFISVKANTFSNLIAENNISKKDINLIKLDIEGAEIEVLINIIEENIYPKQILVEFDELSFPSKTGVKRVDQVHQLLIDNKYSLLYTDGQSDFLYYRE